MALTDAQRRANNKYISKNMTVLGCKVRKDYAEKVRAKCKEDGTTVNAILKRALDEYMLAGAIKEAGKAFLEEQGELLDKEGEAYWRAWWASERSKKRWPRDEKGKLIRNPDGTFKKE